MSTLDFKGKQFIYGHHLARQGWRDRVYPDFIACLQRSDARLQRLCIFETKGQHLEGNRDTTYK